MRLPTSRVSFLRLLAHSVVLQLAMAAIGFAQCQVDVIRDDPPVEGRRFGVSVSALGDTVAIGSRSTSSDDAASIRLLRRVGDEWNVDGDIEGIIFFPLGHEVHVGADGAGWYRTLGSSVTLVGWMKRVPSGWITVQTFDVQDGDVAVCGNRFAYMIEVGSAVFVAEFDPKAQSYTWESIGPFSGYASIALGGDRLFASSEGSSTVEIREKGPGGWEYHSQIDVGDPVLQIDASADGEVVVIDGRLYRFVAGTWQLEYVLL